MKRPKNRHWANLWTRWMSALPAPIWLRISRGGSRAERFLWMEAPTWSTDSAPENRTRERRLPMNEAIAVINAGSSSIKFALYEQDCSLLFRGQVEQIGVSPKLHVFDPGGGKLAERNWPANGFDHRTATREILETAIALKQGTPVAGVGHRVVHGGTRFAKPVRVDEAVMAALAELIPLAPLHQPHNLAARSEERRVG